LAASSKRLFFTIIGKTKQRYALKVDECVFYKGKTILLIYVDNGFYSKVINDIITSLKDQFGVTGEEEIDDYFGVKVKTYQGHHQAQAGTLDPADLRQSWGASSVHE
jgi:hypothetical protein